MSSTLRLQDVYLTPEEYLAAERVSDTKHEYLAGSVYAMAGGTPAHALIALNIGGELRQRLKGNQCKVYGSDALLRIVQHDSVYFYYPDVAVDCTGPLIEFVEAPTVLFEVLSPSTDRNDRGDKMLSYKTIPSLRVYGLVDQQRAIVTLHRRRDGEEWELELYSELTQTIPLPEIGCELPLSEVYRGVFDLTP